MDAILAKRQHEVMQHRRKQLRDTHDFRREKLRRRVYLIMKRRHPDATPLALNLIVNEAVRRVDERRRIERPGDRWQNLEERLTVAIEKRRKLAESNWRLVGHWKARELAARIRADDRLRNDRPLLARRIRQFERGKITDIIVPSMGKPAR